MKMGNQLGVINIQENDAWRWNIVEINAAFVRRGGLKFANEVRGIIENNRNANLHHNGCRVVASGLAADLNIANDEAQEWLQGMRLLLKLKGS